MSHSNERYLDLNPFQFQSSEEGHVFSTERLPVTEGDFAGKVVRVLTVLSEDKNGNLTGGSFSILSELSSGDKAT